MIVPLLMLWLGYGTREATGTSLPPSSSSRRSRPPCRPATATWTSARPPRSGSRPSRAWWPAPGSSSGSREVADARLLGLPDRRGRRPGGQVIAEAIIAGVAAGVVVGPVRRGRRRGVRAGARLHLRRLAGRRRGHVAAGDHPRRARRRVAPARLRQRARARRDRHGLLAAGGASGAWRSPTPSPSARWRSRSPA